MQSLSFQPLAVQVVSDAQSRACPHVAPVIHPGMADGLAAVPQSTAQWLEDVAPAMSARCEPTATAWRGRLMHPPVSRQWDIFCQVIDNYGDIGVCWRLACNLVQRGQRVRLWVDDASALRWLAPSAGVAWMQPDSGGACESHIPLPGGTGASVHVLAWPDMPRTGADSTPSTCVAQWAEAAPDVLIEAFGCELPLQVQQQWAQLQGISAGGDGISASQSLPDGTRAMDAMPQPRRLWLNLEYLSAEDWSRRCHLLASPVLSGVAKGCEKRFFYPGLVAGTGGLLRELDLPERQQAHAVLLQGWQQAASAPVDGMHPHTEHRGEYSRADNAQHRRDARCAVVAGSRGHGQASMDGAAWHTALNAVLQQHPSAWAEAASRSATVAHSHSDLSPPSVAAPALPQAEVSAQTARHDGAGQSAPLFAPSHMPMVQPVSQPISQPVIQAAFASLSPPSVAAPALPQAEVSAQTARHDGTGQSTASWLSASICHAAAQDWAELAVLAPTARQMRISLFCYEPAALPELLAQAQIYQAALLVTPGRAWAAVQQHLHQADEASRSDFDGGAAIVGKHIEVASASAGTEAGAGRIQKGDGASIIALPWLSQRAFDALLWSCHLNCVRGEDSLVRALWAGQALLWHIYPQHDDAHHAKLAAFLDWLHAPADLRHWHWAWNGALHAAAASPFRTASLPALSPQRLSDWQQCVLAARTRLMQQDDLCTQLLAL